LFRLGRFLKSDLVLPQGEESRDSEQVRSWAILVKLNVELLQ